MLVEIVTHCWAKDLPHYAACLDYQVSSLILHKPRKARIALSICCCKDDEKTMQTIRWAVPLLYDNGIPFSFQPLKRNEIGRRSIGRNQVAKNCIGDFVWFADVDQVFRDGIFDRLASMEWPRSHDSNNENCPLNSSWPPSLSGMDCNCPLASMIYPKKIKIHRDHETGDRCTSTVDLTALGLVDVDPDQFVDKRYRKAIGGVQIVRGDFARMHGYLDGIDKWQRPTETPFGDFRDDIAYRNYCLQYGKIVGVDLPGMFRIRHSTTTYQ